MTLEFPQPPKSKIDMFDSDMTIEQRAFINLLDGEELTQNEIDCLEEVNYFYEKCFKYLQSLQLTKLSNSEIEELKKHLNDIIDFMILIENEIKFNLLFRVTKIKDEFLENGKMRDLTYLLCPSISVLQKLGLYNRASSTNASVFYASFHENVALHEIKPQVGERIIITTWQNTTQKPFVSFPIANNETVKNKMLQRSNAAVKGIKEQINPILFDRINSYLLFLSNEFVKSDEITSSNRIEYFYSAFFGDRLLDKTKKISERVKPPNGKGMGNYDCILYPSVAFNHREENIAIAPSPLMENLRPIKIEEYIIEKTDYASSDAVDKSPVKKRVIRAMTQIVNGRIIWNDDN